MTALRFDVQVLAISLRKERSDVAVRRVYELQITHNALPVQSSSSSSSASTTSTTSSSSSSSSSYSSSSTSWRSHCTIEAFRSLAVNVARIEFPSDVTLDALRTDDERISLVQHHVSLLSAHPGVQRNADWLALIDLAANLVAVLESDSRVRDKLQSRIRELESERRNAAAATAAVAAATPQVAAGLTGLVGSAGIGAAAAEVHAQAELVRALERVAALQARCEALESRSNGLERQVEVFARDKSRRREAMRARDYSATVGRAEVRYSDSNSAYTVYCVEIALGGSNFQTFRRFREFHSLHQRLLQLFPEQPIPVLPPKDSILSVFKGQAASQLPKAIDDRRQSLGEYIGALCQLPLVRESVDFQTFLGLPLHIERILKQYDEEWRSAQVVATDSYLADIDRLTRALSASSGALEREKSATKSMRTLAMTAHRSAARRLTAIVDALHEDIDAQIDGVAAGDAQVDSVRELCTSQLASFKTAIEDQRIACDDSLTPAAPTN